MHNCQIFKRKMEGLKEFIKNGETKEALSLLLNHVSDEVLINELLMLNSRLAELESFNRKGILSYDEYSRQKNAINNSILEIYKKHTTPSTHFVFKKRAKPLF